MMYGTGLEAAVFVVTFTGLVAFWSDGAAELYGVSVAYAIGRPVEQLADWHLTSEHVAAYDRIGVGGVWVYVNRVTTLAGVELILATTASVGLDSDGKPEIVIFSEPAAPGVVPRPRAEFLRSVGDPIELVYFCGVDGIVRYTGSALNNMTGYLARDIVGRQVRSFVHPEDVPVWNDAWDVLQRNASRTLTIRVRVRFGDGYWHWVSERFSNLLSDPAVAAIVINASDLTPDDLRHVAPGLGAPTPREAEVVTGCCSATGCRPSPPPCSSPRAPSATSCPGYSPRPGCGPSRN